MLPLLRYLTCLLCSWSLLLYHVNVYAAGCDSDPEAAAAKNNCKEADGKYWDEGTCRCQNTQSAEKLRDVYAECRDEKDETLQRQCMENLAIDASGTSELDDGTYAQVFGSIAKSVATINLLIVVISMVSSDVYSGTCISRYMFMITSLGAFGFEVYTFFALDNKMKDLRKKYRQEVLCQDENGEPLADSGSGGGVMGCMETSKMGPFEAQKKAFQFLEDEQKTISEIARVKWIGYLVIFAAYLATFIAAIIEAVYNSASCTATASTSQTTPSEFKQQSCQMTPNTAALERYEWEYDFYTPITPKYEPMAELKRILSEGIIASAMATSEDKTGGNRFDGLNANKNQRTDGKGFKYDKDSPVEAGPSFYVMLVAGGALGLLGGIIGPVRRALNSPGGYIALSIIAAIGYAFLFPFYIKQDNMAAENAKKVAEIKKMFEAQAGAHCPNGREDLSQPNCYCFLEQGGRNPNREKSETCQALFRALDSKLDLAGDDKKFGPDSEILGCMTRDGKFDRDCRCKMFSDKKSGQNACATAPMAGSNITGAGAGVGVNDALKNLNSLTNGVLSRSLNQADNFGRAKKLMGVAKKLLAKAKKENRIGGKGPSSLPEVLAFANKVIPKEHIAAAAANVGNAGESSSLADPGIISALDQVKEAKKLQMTGGTGNAKKQENKGPDFNFDLGGGPEGNKGDEIGGFMDKKYNYKDNDIVNNEDASIFQVITNRYNQTGYTRLFEEKEEAAPVQK